MENCAENYCRQIEELYCEWRKKVPRAEIFVRDGVVCPELWFEQSVRPLFLLKEAYGGNADWDLIKDLLLVEKDKNGKPHRVKSATWRTLSKWAYGILNTTADNIPQFDKSVFPVTYGSDCLKRIAVMNVKKFGGKKTSLSIKEMVKRDVEPFRAELSRELELIAPTVIVCGGTMRALESIVDGKIVTLDADNWIYGVTIGGRPVIVVDYYHPSKQGNDVLFYYALMHVYQLALKSDCR